MTATESPPITPAPAGARTLSQEETIRFLLERSHRRNRTVPIRREFVQMATPGGPAPGALQSLVRRSQARALDLYLLVSAVTSAGDFSVTEWSTTWARSVGLFDEKSGTVGVSRAWKVLRDLKLINRSRGKEGKSVITKLHEDGSGTLYTPPGGRGEKYFQLPFEYWDEGLHESLSLPAKAMLLIASSLRKEKFDLPQERLPGWYGISADTAGRGLKELQDRAVLAHVDDEWFPTLSTRSGYASKPIYELLPPFHLRGMGTALPESTADSPAGNPSAP